MDVSQDGLFCSFLDDRTGDDTGESHALLSLFISPSKDRVYAYPILVKAVRRNIQEHIFCFTLFLASRVSNPNL